MQRLAGVALCAALAGCGPRSAPPAPPDSSPIPAATTFEGPSGEAVTLESLPARRIISTMASATEWIVALGAADRMVARTDFDRQPELASLPTIGGGLDPSPEVIATLAPDVVIGWRTGGSANLQRALARFGIPVISMETTDTADVWRNLRRMGVLLGLEARADSLAATLRGELAAAASRCTTDDVESAMLVVSIDPPMTAGSGTWMDQVLGHACLRNAFGDLRMPWVTISMEAVTARQPRWLVTSQGRTSGARLAEFRSRPAWERLEAVRAGRIIEIPGDLFSRAGPTLPATVRALVDGRKAALGPTR